MKVLGPRELFEDVQNSGLCIGCGACVDLCPYFRNYKGKTARLFTCNLPQGRCYAHCPKCEVDLDQMARYFWQAPYEGSALGPYREILAARRGPALEGDSFQGGGVVSALMVYALQAGLIDAAVLTGSQGMFPDARLAVNPQEVLECSGSKYAAAPTMAALNRAVRDGYGLLGVAATPCQATAVSKMRMNLLEQNDFKDPVALVVGLFCNWSLDARRLAQFLCQRIDLQRVRRMDIPPPPAGTLVVETDRETLEIPLDQIKPMIPEACNICPDMTAEWADVSVGMFEGRPGWNTLVIRSQVGADIVTAAIEAKFLETSSLPAENLNRLARAGTAKKKRCLTTLRQRQLINHDGDGARYPLRIPEDIAKRLLDG